MTWPRSRSQYRDPGCVRPHCPVGPAAGRAIEARVSSCLFLAGLSVLSGASPLNLGLFSASPESPVSYSQSSPSWVKRYRISSFLCFLEVLICCLTETSLDSSLLSQSPFIFFPWPFPVWLLGPSFLTLLNSCLNYLQYFCTQRPIKLYICAISSKGDNVFKKSAPVFFLVWIL